MDYWRICEVDGVSQATHCCACAFPQSFLCEGCKDAHYSKPGNHCLNRFHAGTDQTPAKAAGAEPHSPRYQAVLPPFQALLQTSFKATYLTQSEVQPATQQCRSATARSGKGQIPGFRLVHRKRVRHTPGESRNSTLPFKWEFAGSVRKVVNLKFLSIFPDIYFLFPA